MKISYVLAFLLTLLIFSATFAQNVSGEWYGIGTVKKAGDHNSYLSELILKQIGNKVTGHFNYFYRSSEIKIKVTGRYDAKFKVLELNAQPMLNFLAKNANGADCPMEGSFTLRTTRKSTTLIGQFNPTYDYRIICPAIDVKFTKSDPKAAKLDLEDTEDEDTASTVVASKKPSQPDTVRKRVTIRRPDSITKYGVIVRPPIIHKRLNTEQQISLALKQRAFDELPVIEVDADSLKVSLYDNGEVDRDSISLFYNRKLVAFNQMLSDKPLGFAFSLGNGVNEISMFAENLGRIPPNTALAIIYAGEQRFELNLTSTFNKNAAIRFKRKIKRIDPKNIN